MQLDYIKNKLSIDNDNLEEIRKKVRKEIVKVHPDKFNLGGKFPSEDIEKEYNELIKILEYIDQMKENSSYLDVNQYSKTIEQQNLIIKQQNEIIELSKKKLKNLESNKLNNDIDDRIIRIKSKNKVPNISLTLLNSVIGFIFLFPENFKNHPIIGVYLENNWEEFTQLWTCLLLISLYIFIILIFIQNKSIKIMNLLKSEQYQDYIFDLFIETLDNQDVSFDKDTICRFIHSDIKYRRHHNSIILRLMNITTIDSDILYEVSDVLIKKALNKNIIYTVKTNTIKDKYKLKKEDEL